MISELTIQYRVMKHGFMKYEVQYRYPGRTWFPAFFTGNLTKRGAMRDLSTLLQDHPPPKVIFETHPAQEADTVRSD